MFRHTGSSLDPGPDPDPNPGPHIQLLGLPHPAGMLVQAHHQYLDSQLVILTPHCWQLALQR